jgi:hypothetical protein
MPGTDSIQPPRELARRVNDGVEIVLFWNEATDELTVCVSDERSCAHFELAARRDQALDVFYHPYAYAASMGIRYDDTVLASSAVAARGRAGLAEASEERGP